MPLTFDPAVIAPGTLVATDVRIVSLADQRRRAERPHTSAGTGRRRPTSEMTIWAVDYLVRAAARAAGR